MSMDLNTKLIGSYLLAIFKRKGSLLPSPGSLLLAVAGGITIAGSLYLPFIAQAQTAAPGVTLTPLYSFGTSGTDALYPTSGLAQGPSGVFYGTSFEGGATNLGTIYQITSSGKETVLHEFNGKDGSDPQRGLVLGPGGNFFGTTMHGGLTYIGTGTDTSAGTVYRITASGMFDSIYSFDGISSAFPEGVLTVSANGDLIGTTTFSGVGGNGYGTSGGTVFEITPTGNLTTLYTFLPMFAFGLTPMDNTDGSNPYGGLTVGPDGNYYGTTLIGGSTPSGIVFGEGTVFQITPDGYETQLYAFKNNGDGAGPGLQLTLGADGNFYGVTYLNPITFASAPGTIFKITPAGQLTTLYRFQDVDSKGYNAHGFSPSNGLTLATDGKFYGTTPSGGVNGSGTIFSITPNGHLTTLYSFGAIKTGNSDGEHPEGPLFEAADGTLYGTASGGGKYNYGTFFKLTVPGLSTPLRIANLDISPSTLQGGSESSSGTVTLTGPAPSAGLTVQLTTPGNTVVRVPATVAIPAGANKARFSVSVGPVKFLKMVEVVASYLSSSQSATVFVTPAPSKDSLAELALSATPASRGITISDNRIYLNGNATASDVVTLTSSNLAVARVPASVDIQPGFSSREFALSTTSVTTPTDVTITATLNGVSKSATLEIQPGEPTLKSLDVTPVIKSGATNTTNTITLTGVAGIDIPVKLTADARLTTTPTTPVIKAGQLSVTFAITAQSGLTPSQTVDVDAILSGDTISKIVTIQAQ